MVDNLTGLVAPLVATAVVLGVAKKVLTPKQRRRKAKNKKKKKSSRAKAKLSKVI